MSKLSTTQLTTPTSSKVLVSDGSGNITTSSTSATELGYVSGVTSALQSQIDSKATEKGVVINYVSNFGAEIDTTGWATYADGAVAAPVDGTGGAPTVTFTRSTSSPLRGVASFILTKDAADRQGQGASYDFTINTADQAKPLQIKLDYTIDSGTYSGGTSSTDSDVTCYIYDVTNAVVIQPSGFKFDGAVIGTNYTLKGSFQAASNSTSYRLIFHVATTSASAYTLKLDNISVSPIVTTTGVAMTDWVDAGTVTITATTTAPVQTGNTKTADSIQWRRVGDSAEVRIAWAQTAAGTNTAGTGDYLFAMPTGLIIDVTKLVPYTTVIGASAVPKPSNSVGSAYTAGTGATPGGVFVYNSTKVRFGGSNTPGVAGNSTSGMVSAGLNPITTATSVYNATFSVPIVGWSSNSIVSSDTDTRVVAMFASKNGGAVTANTTIPTWGTPSDTHGAFNATTGVYTIPVAGWYAVNGHISFASGDGSTLSIYVNGVERLEGTNTTATASKTVNGLLANLKAGDLITMALSTSKTVVSDDTSTTLSIHRLSGPSQIAASETITFTATTSTTAATTSAPFLYTTIVKDSHGAYSAATGKFTAPAPGQYDIKAGVAGSLGAIAISIFKNGVEVLRGTNSGSITNYQVTGAWPAVAGDTFEIRPTANATAAASTVANYFTMTRVGN